MMNRLKQHYTMTWSEIALRDACDAADDVDDDGDAVDNDAAAAVVDDDYDVDGDDPKMYWQSYKDYYHVHDTSYLLNRERICPRRCYACVPNLRNLKEIMVNKLSELNRKI